MGRGPRCRQRNLVVNYIPKRGDIAWINFDPQTGREQAGHRPALVLSPRSFNSRMGMVIVCPITSRGSRHRFEIPLPSTIRIKGVVLSHQVKSLDWTKRQIEYIETAPTTVVNEALKVIRTILR